MPKLLRDILITFFLLAVISFLFLQIGWITSGNDVIILFGIAVAVIALDLAKRAAVSYIRSKKS